MTNLLNVILFFLFVGMYSCNGQKPTNKEITKLLNLTNEEIKKGNLKKASNQLDKIEKLDISNGDVYALKAKIAYFEHDYQKALKLTDYAIKLAPRNSSLLCLKSDIFLAIDKVDSALKNCLQCIDKDKSSTSYLSLALAYRANNDYNSALNCLDSFLTQEKHFSVYSEKGEIYLILKEYKHAIEECNKALALNSNDGLSYYRRGIAYFKIGDTSKCCEDFQIALHLLKDESTIQDIRVFLEKYCK